MQLHIESDGTIGGTRVFDKATGHPVAWKTINFRQFKGDLPVVVVELAERTVTGRCSASVTAGAVAVVPEAKTPEEVARAVCDEMSVRMRRMGTTTTTIHYDAGLTLIADAVRSARCSAVVPEHGGNA